ncbi:galactose-specific lectin nattectin-like isoform X1 [Xiphophorus couchianus]|uniref:galactose-specific lectin nattectin-like isoform X1 n=1 Tax=Xiphophorus couchianus TaxID=32473 RepID=UPI001017117B|nr:galactose-specific lectin nattectin-like isoform X1 [Xiphophorus couchianus]
MAAGLVFTLLLGLSFGLWDGADAGCRLRAPTALDCPLGWRWFNRRCFRVLNISKSWADAEQHCLQLDSHLASYHSTREYNFMRQVIHLRTGKHSSTWVGGHDTTQEGKWFWSDGSKFVFTNWRPERPKNDGGVEHCMNINLNGRDYVNDNVCTKKLPFICARPL